MSYSAIRAEALSEETIGRHVWTARDSRETGLFLAHCLCITALAVVLYAAGPALGLLSVAGGLAVWSANRGSARAVNEVPVQSGRTIRAEQDRSLAPAIR